jgi:glutamine synthetase
MQRQGMLTIEELQELARNNRIDTVLCMFTDLQGRYMGKRVLPDFFIEEILGAEGLHACLYLLAIDMEMEPLPGYRYASWETGYGDFRMIPDLTTLRWCPWIDKTAIVLCDIADEDTSEPVAVAPRQILKDQIAKAAAQGYQVKTGSELEFYLFKDSFDDLAERAYRDPRPSSPYIMDYHMLQTTKDEWFIRQVRNHMRGAGVPIEFSKGEFGKGQHEINITYSDALSNADHHAIYKHGAKEIAALSGVAITFMAKWTMAEAGSSCHLHSSVWDVDGSESIPLGGGKPTPTQNAAPHERHLPVVPGRPDDHRARDGLDVRALRQLLQALPAGVVGSHRHRVEPRQPHLWVPHGRRAHGVPR